MRSLQLDSNQHLTGLQPAALPLCYEENICIILKYYIQSIYSNISLSHFYNLIIYRFVFIIIIKYYSIKEIAKSKKKINKAKDKVKLVLVNNRDIAIKIEKI